MPRTRIIDDNAVLDAAIEIVTQQGIEKLTFQSLSARINLSPSTLVQRFHTKQQLLAAAVERGFQDAQSILQHDGGYNSPLAKVHSALIEMATVVGSVKEYAHGQAFFQLALTDKKIYNKLRESTSAIQQDIKQLLDEAVAAKELRPCDTDELAHTMQAVYEGAITTWIIYQQNDIETWMKKRLSAVTKPYRIN